MEIKKQVLVWQPHGIQGEGHVIPVCDPIELPPEGKPDRVWTLPFRNTDIVPPIPYKPIHGDSAYLEDHGHDWNVFRDKFIYRGRGSHGGCWLLFEYKKD
ncbi:hypothetical protein [Vibrio owensii]|uniref:hypothetical protein n=1 Tax=Vibrio harveyi group TaxID=717610 RepID=UPI003CC5601E